MSLESTLSQVEAQLNQAQGALAALDPLTLENAIALLRHAAQAFAQALAAAPERSRWPSGLAERVQAAAAQLGRLRDQLARVQALTAQQAASVLPPVDGVTYGPSQASLARIYRKPG